MTDPLVATGTVRAITEGSGASGVPLGPKNPPLEAEIGAFWRTPFNCTSCTTSADTAGAVAPAIVTVCWLVRVLITASLT